MPISTKTVSRFFLFVALLVSVSALPVTGMAEGPMGVAFVEAPEQGGGVCHGVDADTAFSCAVNQCMESGALAEDCLKVKWCYPAGWSADIFKQHKEGPHWHHILCGWDSEADLDEAIRIACEGSAREYLIECSAVAKWTPDGEKIELP